MQSSWSGLVKTSDTITSRPNGMSRYLSRSLSSRKRQLGGRYKLSWVWSRLPVAMRPDLVWEVAEPEAALKAVEVWQGEGKRRDGGRATRNVVNIGTHVDVTFGDSGDEGVQGQTEEEGRQRTALFQPVGDLNPSAVGAGEDGEGNNIFKEGNKEVDDPRRRADVPQQSQ